MSPLFLIIFWFSSFFVLVRIYCICLVRRSHNALKSFSEIQYFWTINDKGIPKRIPFSRQVFLGPDEDCSNFHCLHFLLDSEDLNLWRGDFTKNFKFKCAQFTPHAASLFVQNSFHILQFVVRSCKRGLVLLYATFRWSIKQTVRFKYV